MKIAQGTPVKVFRCETYHNFDIGEIVFKAPYNQDTEAALAFESRVNGTWYMDTDEYEILESKTYIAVDVCKDADRYQWLRKRIEAKVGDKTASVVFWLDEPYEPESADELDRMIDNFLEVK